MHFASRKLYGQLNTLSGVYTDNSYLSKPKENVAANGYLNKPNEYQYRKTASVTPTRTTAPTVSRFSTEKNSYISPSPTPQPHTPRSERPWRQRLAESSRIRASLGDDYRSRLSSTDSTAAGPRARTSYTPSFAISYARPQKEVPPKELMSRSYSPIRPRDEIFKSLTSVEKPPISKSRTPEVMSTSQESLREEKKPHGVSSVPKNPSIRESSLERESEKPRRRSSKGRTARRNSRQRGYNQSSSSEEELDRSLTRADAKRRRRRRKEASVERGAVPPASSTPNGMPKSLDSSQQPSKENDLKITVNQPRPNTSSGGGPKAAVSPPVAVPGKQRGPEATTSPKPSPAGPIGAAKTPIAAKDAKGVIMVEVSGPTRKDIQNKPSTNANPPSATTPSAAAVRPQKSNDSWSLDDFVEIDSDESATEASSMMDDESQYSAVVHFKPNKPKVKRVAPVPGLWKVAGADEFISKNKRFVRDQEEQGVIHVWAARNRASVTKRTKATPRKVAAPKPALNKPAETKQDQMKKDDKKEMKENIPAEDKDQKKSTGPSKFKKLFTAKTRPVVEPAKDEKTEVKVEAKQAAGDKKKEVERKEAIEPKEVKKPEPPKKTQAKSEPQKDEKPVVASPATKKDEGKVEKVVPKPRILKEEKTQMAATIKSKSSRAEGISAVLLAPMWLSLKNTKKIREKLPVVTQSVSHAFSKRPPPQAAKKTMQQKKKTLSSTSLSCKATVVNNTACKQELTKKPAQQRAQVIVDKPMLDVNISRVRLRIKRPKHPMPALEEQPAASKETSVGREAVRLRSAEEVKRSPLSQTRASEVLDDMRNSEPAHVVRRSSREEDYNSSGYLILPDQSLLEEYVKRKRGRLERLLSEPIPERDEPRCDSPANSTASELLPACAVRVFERSPHGVPVITTGPSRSVSRLSSVSSVTPTTPTVMLETLTTYNNFNSTPQGFLREPSARIQIAKPIQFDPPKTPFEERLQQQAHAIRKASAASSISGDLDRHSSPRRVSHPTDGMTSLSTSYTAAIAANTNPARHERYAAHIPVNKGDSSGRQSTVSQDSQHRYVWDVFIGSWISHLLLVDYVK
ncbi:hypothetical protein Y032_0171g291 [Ancylostoma ceylanicum]|uniref:Uncharacterized protein n=1 Tax=Ancylostoma ceylanicum TaxID=53326 RepID=A0A016SVK7_9BILA|nr:hypothetical protein Y032_0171g291 [Ancylostoma ceylanicum]